MKKMMEEAKKEDFLEDKGRTLSFFMQKIEKNYKKYIVKKRGENMMNFTEHICSHCGDLYFEEDSKARTKEKYCCHECETKDSKYREFDQYEKYELRKKVIYKM